MWIGISNDNSEACTNGACLGKPTWNDGYEVFNFNQYMVGGIEIIAGDG